MGAWLVFLLCLLYLALLFAIATWANKKGKQGSSVIAHPWVYTLSLAVYCTAWTFYGSVGRAAASGLEFITIYIGPTLMAGLFWPLLRKMMRICRTYRLTSVADFISTRYGKNFSVAVLVTLFAVAGLIPYISLQLKSITESFEVLTGGTTAPATTDWLIALAVTLILMLFTLLYGARSVDAAEKHEGLVAAIAFESVVKLVAFLAVGLFVTYGLFDGFGDIFTRIQAHPQHRHLLTLGGPGGYTTWAALLLLSMLAFILLPRQFQVGLVENTRETHVGTASWGLPLYLLLINLFVLPVAFAGQLLFGGKGIAADHYVLALPLLHGQSQLALFTWLGGFSAATGMIIVETIALSIMISNNLVMPLLLRAIKWEHSGSQSLVPTVLWVRRLSIAAVLMLAFLYSRTAGAGQSLVSIGLISFCAVAQFAPALLLGMYWKRGNHYGAIAGMAGGFAIWAYLLIMPTLFAGSPWLQQGPAQLGWLAPLHFLNAGIADPIAACTVWSLLLNTALYVGVSLLTRPAPLEQYQAELFVEVFLHNTTTAQASGFKGSSSLAEVRRLMAHFVGPERAQTLLAGYANRHKIALDDTERADARLVAFAERVLGGVIGTASARIMVGSLTQQDEINLDEVLNILRENQQMIEMNKELRRKSQELSKATRQLQQANEQLKAMDEQKDEFLYTVTHELRTPLTSIRALSEIVHDNPDLTDEERQQYLQAITRETERLSHLINQVLSLERYESGRHRLHPAPVNLSRIIQQVTTNMQPVAAEKKLELHLQVNDTQAIVQGDAELLTQVIYNLLGNAIKFARHRIQVLLRTEDNEWQVWVMDDGKGIEPGLHQLIFDKFFQARHQTLRKPEGSGLGLAICRKIMDLHGGTIRVESEPGRGASFVVGLPQS